MPNLLPLSRLTNLKPNRIVTSPVTGLRYKIDNVLGEGGFGRAYHAYELNRRGRPIEEVCLKTTTNQASWHRESYFGELFRHSRRVIQLYDSFPLLTGPPGRSTIMYCLVLELAEGGTVDGYLQRTGKPWSAARSRREIIALLKLLDQLHGGGATHRDITPTNIFVCGNGILKLGDFGIARHQVSSGKLITIDAFNPAFVSRGFLERSHRQWLAADDVFQMGQLLAMLLRGDAAAPINCSDANQMNCDPELRAIVKKAIGPRSKRYEDAYEMLQALEGKHEIARSPMRSLQGKTVVFSGRLSIKHFDAEIMVLQAGGTVAQNVTRNVDVVVQGGRGPYRNGRLGAKLRQAQKLIEQGAPIHIIGEKEFRQLVRPTTNRSRS
ncbi:MAG: protein kinase [Proteobacteria bacterium]|nr:protein kinase [Pseudomonadota bacterium]